MLTPALQEAVTSPRYRRLTRTTVSSATPTPRSRRVAARWSSRSVRTRVPNCGSRREAPETPLRVCGIRWRPVSRRLTALKRPVACILDTHHSTSGHEIENLRGGQSVRTPPSAQLRATPLDMKDENPQMMMMLKSIDDDVGSVQGKSLGFDRLSHDASMP